MWQTGNAPDCLSGLCEFNSRHPRQRLCEIGEADLPQIEVGLEWVPGLVLFCIFFFVIPHGNTSLMSGQAPFMFNNPERQIY
jgi:hypothetical protein